MNKIKLAIVALSVLAAGGFMTACNDGPRGTHTPVDANAANPSAGDPTPEAQAEAKMTAEQILLERDKNAQSALNIMKAEGAKYDDSDCSSQELGGDILDVSVPMAINNGQSVKALNIKTVLESKDSSLEDLSYVANAAASRIDKIDNKYCFVRLSGVVSDVTLKNHKENGISSDIEALVKSYESRIEKLEAIVSSFKSKFDSAMANYVQPREDLITYNESIEIIEDLKGNIQNQQRSLGHLVTKCQGACAQWFLPLVRGYQETLAKEVELINGFTTDAQIDPAQMAARAGQAKAVADQAQATHETAKQWILDALQATGSGNAQ